MQVFVCTSVCTLRFLRPSLGVWMAPVFPASHLSPLQDKGSSVSGPLLRLLEMIWSVLLSTEKIISSQRGCPLGSAGPCQPAGRTTEPATPGGKDTQGGKRNSEIRQKRKLKRATRSGTRSKQMRKQRENCKAFVHLLI